MTKLPAEYLPRYDGLPAVIVGNAPTRNGININELRGKAIVFGCNRLFEDVDFKGYPFFLGCCDETIYEMIGPHQEWRNNHNVVCYHDPPHPVMDHFKVDHIQYPKSLKWKDTGTAMAELAIFLGCKPVYLVGFCGLVNMREDSIIDNMYQHDITKKGFRQQNNFQVANGMMKEFSNNLLEIAQKNPGILVDVRGFNPGQDSVFDEIQTISYPAMFNTLQLEITSKVTVINGMTVHV